MISLDQVLLLEQKVESAVEKIKQLEGENAALRNKCSELTNALSAKSEQLSSFETDQNKIEQGIRKALDRLNIRQKLAPWPVSEALWQEFWDSERINDRGVAIDREIVKNAIQLNALENNRLMERLKTLTGLENPNSVPQMKQWLLQQGVLADNLDKNAIRRNHTCQLAETNGVIGRASIERNVRAPLRPTPELFS